MSDYTYFRFTIKNEKYPIYRKIAAFIFLINALVFFYAAIQSIIAFQRILLIVTGIILSVYCLFSFFSKNNRDRSYIVLYILAALIWVTEFDLWLPALVLIGLMIMQRLSQAIITVSVNQDGVVMQSATNNFYPAADIKYIVLKDGLMTIDLRSNKMLQIEPDFTEPIIIRKGGSHHDVNWNIGEDYPDLENAFNKAFHFTEHH